MWFLKGCPSSIQAKVLVSSVQDGYQYNNFRFAIESAREDEDKMWVAIAVPWSPHKPNGSIKFNDNDGLTNLDEEEEKFCSVEEKDVVIYDNLRSLKKLSDIELVHVQDLINWHLDDIAVMTFWIESGQTYQLNYSHKIAPDSKLFVPTRLPIVFQERKLLIDYKIWVINGMCYDLQKFLKRNTVDSEKQSLYSESLDLLTFNDWTWDEDVRIHTDNWASSDDGETE